MSRLRATDPIRVEIGECECPGTPHEKDEAVLPGSLDPWDATDALALLQSGDDASEIEGALARVFLRKLSWNLIDDDGPVDPKRFGEFSWSLTGPIVDAVMQAYTAELLAPFRRARQKSSPRGQTEASISPTPPSTEENP